MKQPHLNPSRPRHRTAGGFTLIEMVICLAIASVLLGVTVPALGSMVNSLRLSSFSNRLLSELQLARSEAIKRNKRVALCKSADGATCSAVGGWEQGWIVFHDSNNNGARDTDEAVVYREQALPGELRVSGNQNVARYISFSPTGETKLLSGAFQAGTITVCHHSDNRVEARQIVINAIGRPRVQKAMVESCG